MVTSVSGVVFSVRELACEALADYSVPRGTFSDPNDAIAWAQACALVDVFACFVVDQVTVNSLGDDPTIAFTVGPMARPSVTPPAFVHDNVYVDDDAWFV